MLFCFIVERYDETEIKLSLIEIQPKRYKVEPSVNTEIPIT